MNFPIQPELLGIPLPLHFIFETLAFVVGYRYYIYLRKSIDDHISFEGRIRVIIGAALGALIGSRLLGAMEQPLLWMAAEQPWLYLYSNKTIVGGFVGGWIGVEIAKKLLDINQSTGDLFIFPMIIALIIGRLGCFSMGVAEETYGIQSTLPWAMDLGDGVARHPVTLYEILFLFLLLIVLRYVNGKWNLINGILFKIFMICYMGYRFFQDFIKPVFTYNFINLSSIQIVCLAVLIYYHKTIYRLIFDQDLLKIKPQRS